ncbi:FtsX-like permease family protein [Micromonospora sp. CA-263727]|uniref:FtsX-like permease family protein n=1 Tax=Micromonospora sp. CA-263727 TaxID=3239967 RepID=UPI003D9276CE
MSQLRLMFRLVRGGGVSGLVRLALMVCGIAAGVVVMVFVATMPSLLAKRGETTSARQALPVLDGETAAPAAFEFEVTQGSWRGVRFTRILLTSVRAGASTPPGVERLPLVGEVLLSPGAARLAAQEEDFARLVPGREVGRIGPEGLIGPDEIFAYVGISRDLLGNPIPGRGWGGAGFDLEMQRRFSNVPWQLSLILVGPMVIYLNVCARLSAATRTRRYAALRLVGASRRQVLRLAALESGLAGLAGALLGLAGYAAANEVIGPSGVVGFTWYPTSSRLSWPMIVGVTAVVVSIAGIVGSLNTSRALSRPLHARFDVSESSVRWWYAAPFVLGLGLLVYPLLALFDGSRRPGSSDSLGSALILGGVVLVSVGLLLALRPILIGFARRVAESPAPVTARIAARRIEHEAGGLTWHLAGLCLLVLVAGIGASVLRQTELSASPGPDRLTLHLYGNTLTASALGQLHELPAEARWTTQRSIVDPPEAGANPQTPEEYLRVVGATMVTADCATLRLLTSVPLNDCRDGHRYRLRTPHGGEEGILPVEVPLRFQTGDGREATVTAPADVLDVPVTSTLPWEMGLVITDDRPDDVSSDSILYFLLPPGIVAMDRFASRLAETAPASTVNVHGLDLSGLEAYRVHRGTIDVGIVVAFFLGITAFFVSTLARSIERRREVASLVVVGMRATGLRAVQRWQVLAPLSIALGLALLTSHVAGNSLLRVQGEQFGWYWGTVELAAPVVGVALLCAAVVASVVVGIRPRSEDLRRE